jgi:hypothetical protein
MHVVGLDLEAAHARDAAKGGGDGAGDAVFLVLGV